MPRAVRYLLYLLVVVIVLQLSWRLFGPFGLIVGIIILFALGVWKVSSSN